MKKRRGRTEEVQKLQFSSFINLAGFPNLNICLEEKVGIFNRPDFLLGGFGNRCETNFNFLESALAGKGISWVGNRRLTGIDFSWNAIFVFTPFYERRVYRTLEGVLLSPQQINARLIRQSVIALWLKPMIALVIRLGIAVSSINQSGGYLYRGGFSNNYSL